MHSEVLELDAMLLTYESGGTSFYAAQEADDRALATWRRHSARDQESTPPARCHDHRAQQLLFGQTSHSGHQSRRGGRQVDEARPGAHQGGHQRWYLSHAATSSYKRDSEHASLSPDSPCKSSSKASWQTPTDAARLPCKHALRMGGHGQLHP